MQDRRSDSIIQKTIVKLALIQLGCSWNYFVNTSKKHPAKSLKFVADITAQNSIELKLYFGKLFYAKISKIQYKRNLLLRGGNSNEYIHPIVTSN